MWLQTLRDWQVWSQDVSWGRVGFDTETNGLDWNTLEIWGASFADGRNSCYINLLDNPEKPEILAAIWDRLLTVKTLIGHNLAFDLKVLLKTYGEKANQWMMGVTLVDTYCADFLLDERGKHSLKGPGGCLDRHLGAQCDGIHPGGQGRPQIEGIRLLRRGRRGEYTRPVERHPPEAAG